MAPAIGASGSDRATSVIVSGLSPLSASLTAVASRRTSTVEVALDGAWVREPAYAAVTSWEPLGPATRANVAAATPFVSVVAVTDEPWNENTTGSPPSAAPSRRAAENDTESVICAIAGASIVSDVAARGAGAFGCGVATTA